jgi:hypothetical protein
MLHSELDPKYDIRLAMLMLLGAEVWSLGPYQHSPYYRSRAARSRLRPRGHALFYGTRWL